MTTHDADGGGVDVASRLAGYRVTRLPHPTGFCGRLVLVEMVRLMERPEPLFGDEVRFVSGLRGGRVDAVKVPA